MEPNPLFEQLELNSHRIAALAAGVAPEQARYRPDQDAWSILEVINHLDDEERLDFRVRLDLLLHHPQEPWPPIDPKGWVTARKYNERELGASVENFLQARQSSLAWLRNLEAPDWEAQVGTPWGGTIAAGDLLAAWAAHDMLHMRQLVELHRAWIERAAGKFSLEYAGPW